MAELAEMLDFLSHANPLVRVQACQMLGQVAKIDPYRQQVATWQPRLSIVRKVLPLVSDTSTVALSKAALETLIVLSEDDTMLEQMLELKMVHTLMDLARDPHTPNVDLFLMLLCNLTRVEQGCTQLMQEGTVLQGLHIRRILSWFLATSVSTSKDVASTSAPPSAPSQLPRMTAKSAVYLSYLLLNVSQLPSGRQFLLSLSASASTPVFPLLVPHMQARDHIVRTSILTLFRNLFMVDADHALLMRPEHGVVRTLLLLIAGHGEVREHERDDAWIPDVLRAMQSPSHKREPDPANRRLILECILFCGRHAPSRTYLRSIHTYVVLRELHLWEQANKNDELDELLFEIVPYFILDEDGSSSSGDASGARGANGAAAPLQLPAASEEASDVAEVANVASQRDRDANSASSTASAPSSSSSIPRARAAAAATTAATASIDDEHVMEKVAELLADLNIEHAKVDNDATIRQQREQIREREREQREREQREQEERLRRSIASAKEDERKEKQQAAKRVATDDDDDDDLPDLVEVDDAEDADAMEQMD